MTGDFSVRVDSNLWKLLKNDDNDDDDIGCKAYNSKIRIVIVTRNFPSVNVLKYPVHYNINKHGRLQTTG
jgi:hypothetical protein